MSKIEVNNEKKNTGDMEEDIEQITINVIKILLQKNVSLEDIQHITGKTIEEIERIGSLGD